MQILKILMILLLSIIPLQGAMAQEVWITISDAMEGVVFDGKWTEHGEWKKSSLNNFLQDGYYLRSAHQGNFIYFLIDFVTDVNLDVGQDKAMICLNPQEESLPDEQFCFISTLETDNSSIIKKSENSANFEEITKHESFIGISSTSDENDRYSATPHSTYEFRIPTDLVGRSNQYGLYIAIYEANSDSIFTFPSNTGPTSFDDVPDVNKWGKLISPDKSLPEFHWLIVLVVSSFSIVIFLTRTRILNSFQ